MKELSIEEKAKLYDKAIIKFKPIYDLAKEQGRTIDVKEFEDIFPELKESEDERIKKAIIALIEFGLEDKSAIAPGYNLTKEEAIDWLKSLKDRYAWKPSDEQMEAFYTYLYNPQYIDNSDDYRLKLVISLYEQLKKLKQ